MSDLVPSRRPCRHVCNNETITERSLHDINSASAALKHGRWMVNTNYVLRPKPMSIQSNTHCSPLNSCSSHPCPIRSESRNGSGTCRGGGGCASSGGFWPQEEGVEVG
eukprot:146240-Pyramimonas_sp.AAC.1